MGLLAPAFLFGMFAVALPVWLHRLQTQDSTRQPFASTMLLVPAERRTHVHRKIRFRWLLALRVLLLLLLALAFAKPVVEAVRSVAGAPAQRTHVVVVDTSLSMNDEALFAAARDRARALIEAVPDGDAVLVLDAAAVDAPGAAAPGRDEALARLEGLRPGTHRLDFGATVSAVERRVEEIEGAVTVSFTSDFQASAVPIRFADLVPDEPVELGLRPVSREARENLAIEYVHEREGAVVVGVRRHQASTAPDREVEVVLRIDDGQLYRAATSIGVAGEARFEGLDFAEGEHRIEARLENADDAIDGDNRYYFALDRRPPVSVPVLTDEADGLALTYIEAALLAAGGSYTVEPLRIGQYDPRVLSRYQWLIVTDLGALDRRSADALEAFLDRGGNVLAFAAAPRGAAQSLPVAGNALAPARVAARESAFIRVAGIDASHPLLRETAAWEQIRLARYVPVVPEADDRVLVRLETGEPLLFERHSREGGGRLLVLTSALDSQWSDLATRPVFVSFMIEVAASLSGSARLRRQYTLGDTLVLESDGGQAGQVVDPGGQRMLSLAATRSRQRVPLDTPGFYEVYTAGSQTLIAANVDPRESDLTPMETATMDRWRAMLAGRESTSAADVRPAASDDGPPSTPLWPWLLALLGIVAVVETLTANAHLRIRTGNAS